MRLCDKCAKYVYDRYPREVKENESEAAFAGQYWHLELIEEIHKHLTAKHDWALPHEEVEAKAS
jgi:hypothetical protein